MKLLIYIITILLLSILYLLPIVIQVDGQGWYNLFIDQDGFLSSLVRSLSFAILATLVVVPLSFVGALSISTKENDWKINLLIIPFSLGSVGSAFIFKTIFFNSWVQAFVVTGEYWTRIAFMIMMLFWQFGFLFVFLFWATMKSIPDYSKDYFNAYNLPQKYLIKDVVFPRLRGIIIISTIICFINAFYEDAKSQLILKASRGTNSELINHWLDRTFQSLLLVRIDVARKFLFDHSIVVFVVVACAMVLVTGFALFLLERMSSGNSQIGRNILTMLAKVKFSKTAFIIAIMAIIVPIMWPFTKITPSISQSFNDLIGSLGLTITASIIIVVIALVIVSSIRIIFRNELSELNFTVVGIILSTFILLLFAPITIIANNYVWFGFLKTSAATAHVVWFLSQAILVFPILFAFLFSFFLLVRREELDYLSIHKISRLDILKVSFIKRFWSEIVLTALLTFAIIWTEKSANIVVSEYISSFSQKLELAFIGRGSDYSAGLLYYSIGLTVSLSIYLFWQRLSRKYLH